MIKARLGLAQALSKDRRFDEAREEFEAYLKRRPKDTTACLGLGRDAFQQGNIEDAGRYFETAFRQIRAIPRHSRSSASSIYGLGRVREACERLKLLTEIEPFDHEVRYLYAQSLKLAGNAGQATSELEQATRLRKEHDQIVQLRYCRAEKPERPRYAIPGREVDDEHGHEDEGLKWTKEILRANPRHAPTHGVLAEYYSKHGEPGLANFHRLSAKDTSAVGSQ